jgi:hypothetical protein
VRKPVDRRRRSRERISNSLGREGLAFPIGIGRSLAAPPSHTTVRTWLYTAVRLIKRAAAALIQPSRMSSVLLVGLSVPCSAIGVSVPSLAALRVSPFPSAIKARACCPCPFCRSTPISR